MQLSADRVSDLLHCWHMYTFFPEAGRLGDWISEGDIHPPPSRSQWALLQEV